MATNAAPTHRGTYVPISEQELILRDEKREISLLLAKEDLSLTYGSCAAGERVAGPHIHNQHTDAFYVLEGELTCEIGFGPETVTIGAGSLVAAPPSVAHSLRNAGPSEHAGSPSTPPTAASPTSCAASATASRSNGTSPRCRRTAIYPQTTPSSAGPSGGTTTLSRRDGEIHRRPR